jgi:tyrosyl-tRNA synthetase
VAITDPPPEMFGKIMRIPDELMASYFELLTDVPLEEAAVLTDPSKSNPRDVKERLAKSIVSQYHLKKAADAAAEEFRRVFGGGGGVPDEVPEAIVPADKLRDGKIVPLDLITACLGEKSRGEARRLVSERGVRLNGEPITDALAPIAVCTGDLLQRGKRRFVRLVVP